MYLKLSHHNKKSIIKSLICKQQDSTFIFELVKLTLLFFFTESDMGNMNTKQPTLAALLLHHSLMVIFSFLLLCYLARSNLLQDPIYFLFSRNQRRKLKNINLLNLVVLYTNRWYLQKISSRKYPISVRFSKSKFFLQSLFFRFHTYWHMWFCSKTAWLTIKQLHKWFWAFEH